jgi:hypothetical protein
VTGEIADLYVRFYTNYTSCQSLKLHLAFAAFSLERLQLSFEFLHIAFEYIPSITIMTIMSLGEPIAATPCHAHQQEVVERALEGRPQFLKAAANPGL